LFISGTAAGAVWHPDSLAFYIIFKGKVAAANATVHAAGGD
jgi:hypothetical protein